jgi:CRP-like cAMP-binding protein
MKTLRTATLTTVQPCTFLYLSAIHFEALLRLAPEIRSNGLLTSIIQKRIGCSLKTIPLFSFLRLKEIGPLRTFREDVLEKLGKLFTYEFHPRETVVCKEGSVADAFYIITRGAVEVRAKADPNVGPDEVDEDGQIGLTELGQSDFFGELAIFSQTRRTATVKTITDCMLLKLEAKHFQTFLDVCPEIQATLERVISTRTAQSLAKSV